MVVWQDGDMKKDDYKRYKIRTVTGTDDFASMHEVLTRRYGRALEGDGVLPDLVLLDGGRGQLGVGVKALEDLGLDYLPIASLAKRAEEVYLPDRLEPLVLDLGSPALQALQRIRDEAHRFAITYHKKLRQRRTIASVLDEIPGVGPTVRTSLLKTLGSARGCQGRLGGGAGLGAEGHAEARQAHLRLLPRPGWALAPGNPRRRRPRDDALTHGAKRW